MSFEALAWGVKQNTNSSISKLVLLMICNYANEKGEAYPSQEHLAKLCQCSRISVTRHIKELQKSNYISIRKEKNGAYGFNLYILNMGYVSESNKPLVSERYLTGITEIQNTQDIQITSKFENWWSVVPRKIGKKKAKSIYERLVKSKEVTEDELISSMKRYAESVKHTEDKFVAHASSWLNAGRWTDTIEVKVKNKNWLAG
jgi:DNA-binding transcriptional MocR family regulator